MRAERSMLLKLCRNNNIMKSHISLSFLNVDLFDEAKTGVEFPLKCIMQANGNNGSNIQYIGTT